MRRYLIRRSKRNKKIALLSVFGNIQPPDVLRKYPATEGRGLIILFNNLLKFFVVIAGLFALVQLILAGYGFISAAGDSDKVNEAWNKIWQSLLGLLIVAGSFALAAVFGKLIFGSYEAILNPKIYGP